MKIIHYIAYICNCNAVSNYSNYSYIIILKTILPNIEM